MPASTRRAAFALSVLFAAAPFVAALIRFASAGDLRMLRMALASALGAGAVAALPVRRELLVLIATTLIAGATAYLLGATAAAGIWPVALTFGICWTASFALYRRARAPLA